MIKFMLCMIKIFLISKPFAESMKFTQKNKKKFPESMWKFVYYLSMYTYTCFILFGKHYELYEDPRTCWSGKVFD